MNAFSSEESSVLLRLIAAHLVTDFYLQKGSWVKSKTEKNLASPYLWLHAFIASVLAWLFVWQINFWWVFAVTFISHLFIDAWKIQASNKVLANPASSLQDKTRKELRLFIIDQAIHFMIIVLLWLLLINGFNKLSINLAKLLPDSHFLLRMLGYLMVLQPTGFLIGFITKRWLPELNMKDSLQDAGKWIGMLERAIVLTLVYSNQYSAIGFLIAAKSILRVTDKPESNTNANATPFSSRKHTEYVLIGTFLSFGIALIVGIGVNYLLHEL